VSSELDYVCLKPCGCMGMWMSGELNKKDLAKDLSKAVKEGLDIQRVTTEQAKKLPFRCSKCRPAEQMEFTE